MSEPTHDTIARLRHHLKSGLDTGHDVHTREVLLSNIYGMRPQLSRQEMDESALQSYFRQCQSIIEANNFLDLLPSISCIGNTGHLTNGSPAIYVSFHYASYRLLLIYLASLRIPLTALMYDGLDPDRRDGITDNVARMFDVMGYDKSLFKIMDTSSAAMLFSLSSDLKQGRSVFIYVDGNQSVGGWSSTNRNSMRIPFLGHDLHARYGASAISWLTKVPLVPVIAHRRGAQEEENVFQFFDDIRPNGGDKQAFFEEATVRQWRNFEPFVERDLTNWEALKYSHKFMEYNPVVAPGTAPRVSGPANAMKFNHERYGVFHAGEFDSRPCLFDRKSRTVAFPGDRLFGVISGIVERGADMAVLPAPLRQWLCERSLIVAD